VKARWVFERASNAFAHCGISSVEKELNLLFSPLFLLEGCFVSACVCARKKNRARARARDPNESSDAGENESRRFFSRARIVLRVRAILARVVVVVAARARLQISKGERWGRSRRNVSHVRSRKNPKNARVASSAPFSCRPSIAQNSYREASSKMVSRANSPSPRKTRRRVNTPTTRGWCLCPPPNLCRCFFFLCVFSLVFFGQPHKGVVLCLVFKGVDARQPSKRGKSPFFCVSLSPPPKRRFEILFFCGI